ncbi:hypothetical protein GW17_00008716 [Ensete ventricosum]|nr:hypothetical protein GW17_00008716 [Ensete ventricosum]
MTFQTEAVLPPETVFPTLRVEHYEERASEEGLCYNLDQMEEQRARAHMRMLAYKNAVARLYNQKVCSWPIKDGDLVPRKTEVSDPTYSRGKLASN